ncbi:MAG: hypothetical protein V1910_03085 [bacterium]
MKKLIISFLTMVVLGGTNIVSANELKKFVPSEIEVGGYIQQASSQNEQVPVKFSGTCWYGSNGFQLVHYSQESIYKNPYQQGESSNSTTEVEFRFLRPINDNFFIGIGLISQNIKSVYKDLYVEQNYSAKRSGVEYLVIISTPLMENDILSFVTELGYRSVYEKKSQGISFSTPDNAIFLKAGLSLKIK